MLQVQPVGLIKNQHFNVVQVERWSIAQVINESSRCGDDDVR